MNNNINDGRQVPKNLGSTLKYLREKKGYSLQKMFELTGVSPSYLNRLELGERRNPSIIVIKKIADALEVPLEKLIDLLNEDENDETERIPTLAESIIYNPVTINGKIITNEVKLILLEIIEDILDFSWTGEDKNKEIYELLKLIEKLKKVS